MAGVRRLSILVADDDPEVIADYRTILCAPKSALPPDLGDFACIEDDLFRAALAHDRFPEVDLSVAARPGEAVQAVRHSVDAGERYAMAFIGVELRQGDRGLAAAESIRVLDPDMPIVLVAACCGMHPLDVYDRIPLTSRIAILVKPFHAVEVQNLALSLAAGRRAEETTLAAAGLTSSLGTSIALREDRAAMDKKSKAAGGKASYPCLDSTMLTDSGPPEARVVRAAQDAPWIPLRAAQGPALNHTDLTGDLSPGRSDDHAPSTDGDRAD